MSDVLQGPRPASFRNQYWSGGWSNSSSHCMACDTVLHPGDPIITKSGVTDLDQGIYNYDVIAHLCRPCGIKFANEAEQIVVTRNPSINLGCIRD